MAKRDYYDVLGVKKSASTDEIRQAHRKLARQFHPDMNKNNAGSTERFKEVQEAYDVLSDAEKRRAYDEHGHAGPRMGPPPGAADPFEAFRRAGGGGGRGGQWRAGQGAGGQGGPGMSPEDMGGFADIFEQMFGGQRPGADASEPFGGGGGGTRGGAKGADIEHAVQLTFEQAARGITLPVRMQGPNGTETIEVKIPSGVSDGNRIRVKGKGQPGPRGNGDLFIVAKVAAHPMFRREGNDVYCDIPVSAWDAMLGTKVAVPTLEGEVTMTLPPGTSSGAKLRIKGRGVKRGDEQGDQYAIVKVVVPKDLSAEAKELVEQLKKLAPVRAT